MKTKEYKDSFGNEFEVHEDFREGELGIWLSTDYSGIYLHYTKLVALHRLLGMWLIDNRDSNKGD